MAAGGHFQSSKRSESCGANDRHQGTADVACRSFSAAKRPERTPEDPVEPANIEGLSNVCRSSERPGTADPLLSFDSPQWMAATQRLLPVMSAP